MNFLQCIGGATTAILAAALFVPGARGEEPVDTPVAEAVSTAEPTPTEPMPRAEQIPAAEPIPSAETVLMHEKVTTAEPIPSAEPVSPAESTPTTGSVPVAEMAPAVELNPAVDPDSETEVIPMAEATADSDAAVASPTSPSAEEVPSADENPTVDDPAEADPDEEGKMTLRELALQSHREQMKIYDLDGDGTISEEEWKAANEDDLERIEKFFLVDEDEDGEIDEKEAVGFLMERVSLSSTYLDATGDENADILQDDIKDAAPSELRVTLFSIPLGD